MATPVSHTLRLDYAGGTDVGVRRENNEDAWWAGGMDQLAATTAAAPSGTLDLRHGAWLGVSDGLGGANAGEIASRVAIQETQGFIARHAEEAPTPEVACDALNRANAAINRAAHDNPQWTGMGATLSFLWLRGCHAVIGQVGDSRVYRLRGEWLEELSVDHSPVGRLRQSGQLSEVDARHHPSRHVIDQCLGGGDHGLAPDCEEAEVQAGDVLLLCSDGLTDGVSDAELAAVLGAVARTEIAPTAAVATLIERANRLSGRDNVTVIVARCVGVA